MTVEIKYAKNMKKISKFITRDGVVMDYEEGLKKVLENSVLDNLVNNEKQSD